MLPRRTDDSKVIERFAALVRTYCRRVEELKFVSLVLEEPLHQIEIAVHALLERFSSQLRSIDLIRNYDHLFVPDINVCTNIRDLKFPASSELSSFLRACGSSLESLTVSFNGTSEYAEMLDLIEHTCTKLTSILLIGCFKVTQVVGEERYASLLRSFGPQLTCAKVDGLSVGKLAQVLEDCPSLLIETEFVSDDGVDEWERVGLLGSMIKHLTVAANMCRGQKCEEAIRKCTNLEVLEIERNYAHEEQATENSSDVTFLLLLSSSSLTHVYHRGFVATHQNICTLSSALKNLNHLTLSLVEPIESGIDFSAIAHSNPQLGSVAVFEDIDDGEKRRKDELIEVLGMLVSAFSKCHSIDFTLFNDGEQRVTRDEIQDICGPLRCRGVTIEINVGSTSYRVTN